MSSGFRSRITRPLPRLLHKKICVQRARDGKESPLASFGARNENKESAPALFRLIVLHMPTLLDFVRRSRF